MGRGRVGYEPIAEERFAVERAGTGELIRVRAERNLFVMLFLPVWLAGWTAGGAMAATEAIRTGQPFLLVWLAFWAAAWLVAASTLAWMFLGSQTLRVAGGDLEVAHHLLGWSRRRLYRGDEIRHLAVAAQPAWPYRFRWQPPFGWGAGRYGAVKFDYGARTIYVAPGLDEAEGRRIAERLRGELPGAAG